MIHLENISVLYNKRVLAVDAINLRIEKGEFIGVIGLSGSGKSSLLKTINLLVQPHEGSVLIAETKINTLKAKDLRNVRRKIGYIFQDYNLVERSSVLDNVLMGRLGYKSAFKAFFGFFDDRDYTLACQALRQVGLEEKTFAKASQLSGGQKQRVAIAKALCQEPNVILADEPVASLDQASSSTVMSYFKEINQERAITIVMNLHDVALARKYCSRIIALKEGKVFFDKEVGEVSDQQLQELYQ